MEEEFEEKPATVGDLRRELEGLDDGTTLLFAGGLTLFRVKRSDDACVVEFNEPLARMSEAFQKKNPNVKAAFIDGGNVLWGESGTLQGSIDVEI
ncbi:MAG TPA: hypothetical protein VIQ28_05530 [Burkholderiales bacterium]|jgi:hypothetical protein